MSYKKTRRVFLKSMTVSGLVAGAGSSSDIFASDNAPIRPSSLNFAGKRYINPRKVLLYECTRKEIREALASGKLKAAIIPTGATEQHNEHLAMIMDTAGALLISQYTALKLYPHVTVTTPVSIGVSPHWMNRKGTLTLRKEIFQEVVYDVCESLKKHGIRTILIVNGHGGNIRPLNEKVPEFRSKLGINIETCSYWDSISRDQRKSFVESGVVPGHASEFETSIALAAFPERIRYQGVDHDKAKLTLSENERKVDKAFFEESKLASAEKGERIIAHAVNWVAEKLLTMIE